MAFSIIYKKLFELRVIHPYFFKDESYFSDGDQNLAYLQDVDYNILNHISIIPVFDCQEILDDQRLLFKKSIAGFTVWAEAFEASPGVFKPYISIADELTFSFAIQLTDQYFDSFSNVRLRPNVKGVFYFDNFRNKDGADFPSLSRKPATQSDREYEMGEIIAGNKMAKVKTASPGTSADWANIDDYKYVTYNDRLLVPSRFTYRFTPSAAVDTIDPAFSLYDDNNDLVEKEEITGNTKVNIKQLDYAHLPEGWYRLEVSKAQAVKDIKEVLISNRLYDSSFWGLIEINNSSSENQYQLLESDDSLRSPIFEIRPLNRPTYWKYHLNQWDIDQNNLASRLSGSTLFSANAPTDFETKEPIRLSKYAAPLAVDNNLFVATPHNHIIKPINDKNYSEIFLEKSNI